METITREATKRTDTCNINIYDLDSLTVYDENGTAVSVQSLYESEPCIMVLLRHFLCYVYHDYVEDWAKVDLAALRQRGVRLALIGCGEWRFIKSFKARTGFGGDVYADTDRAVYRLVGCKSVPFKGTRGPQRTDFRGIHCRSSVMAGFFKSLWRSMEFREWQGDTNQQGGAVIISNQRRFLYWRVDNSPLDHTPINDLLQTVGLPTLNFPNDRRVQEI